VLQVFVAIQPAWVLRPFIGAPDRETTFLSQGTWSNAYVEITRVIFRVLGIDSQNNRQLTTEAPPSLLAIITPRSGRS